jgi:hypothetical protein
MVEDENDGDLDYSDLVEVIEAISHCRFKETSVNE